MRTLILLTITLLSISCKKYGEPFKVEFDILAKKAVARVEVVRFHNNQEKEQLYYDQSTTVKYLPSGGFFTYSTPGSFDLRNNEGVLFKVYFLEKEKVEYRIMIYGYQHDGTAINGEGQTHMILTSDMVEKQR